MLNLEGKRYEKEKVPKIHSKGAKVPRADLLFHNNS